MQGNLVVIFTIAGFGTANLTALLILAFRLGRRDSQVDGLEHRVTRLENFNDAEHTKLREQIA
jgi:hypothetical protein